MKQSEHIDIAIDRAYRLESLLRVLSLAIDGEEIAGTTLAESGGRSVIKGAAKLAGEIVDGLESGDKENAA